MWENKTNKKKSKWKSLKTAAAWGRPGGGVSHLYWKVIHKRGESPWGILCLPFLGTLPARPKMFIHKTTRGIVSGVTLGQSLSVTNSSQACFSRRWPLPHMTGCYYKTTDFFLRSTGFIFTGCVQPDSSLLQVKKRLFYTQLLFKESENWLNILVFECCYFQIVISSAQTLLVSALN